MNNISVSVVMPVYNAELYIEEALDSIMNQTLENIELICVDDESSDRTPEILAVYEKLYDNVTVIRQKSSFAGIARNNGLSRARGKYVIFLDADDIFELDMLKVMYDKAENTSSDICICNGAIYDNAICKKSKIKRYLTKKYMPDKTVFSYKDIPDSIYNITTPSVWNLLFRRDFILDNGFQFEGTRRANDLRFYGMSMTAAKRITTVDRKFVNYRTGMKTNTQAKHDDFLFCEYETLKQVRDYIVSLGEYEVLRKGFLRLCVSNFNYILGRKTDRESFVALRDRLLNDDDALFTIDELKEAFDDEEGFGIYREFMDRLTMPVDKLFPRDSYKSSVIEIIAPIELSEMPVSVIIPTYNDGRYIKECLDSLVNQTFRPFEIIIVNDGSTDETSEICKVFTDDHKDDNGLQVVYIVKSNGGVSSARNTGLECVHGKYVKFLDGDDMYTEDCIENCMRAVSDNDVDILYAGIHAFTTPGASEEELPILAKKTEAFRRYYRRDGTYALTVSGPNMFVKQNIRNEYISPVSTMTINNDFIKRNELYFEDTIHEDELFSFMAAITADRAAVINNVTVHRRVRPGSIMTNPENELKSAVAKLDIACRILSEGRKVAEGNNFDSRFNTIISNRVCSMIKKSTDIIISRCGTWKAGDMFREYYVEYPDFYNLINITIENRNTANTIKKLRADNAKVRDSFSWRITEPFRAIRRRLIR